MHVILPGYQLFCDVAKPDYEHRLVEKSFADWYSNPALLYAGLHVVLLSEGCQHKIDGMFCAC